jgi:hypothetical protein
MSVPMKSTTQPPATTRRWRSRGFLLLSLCLSLLTLWTTVLDGRIPAVLSPTVARTLYFKLPIAGTRFHWTFFDRRAFLSGDLTIRILNVRRKRDQTLVIFRDGKITDGWQMIGDLPRDSSVYFGFSTRERFATTVGDSVIITLIAAQDLFGRGPLSQGTLAKGTWVATGTYSGLYGGTLNPLRDLVNAGEPPVAFLTCWDTVWLLRDVHDVGWMGAKPAAEKELDSGKRQLTQRGVDGRRCRSTL